MRRLLLASVGLTALAASALAADMPPSRYMPPPRGPLVPFFSWNGFYLGINGGYGFGRSKWTNTVTGATTGDFDVDGGLVGGTAGFNYQTGGFVFGIEADLAWSNLKGSTVAGCPAACETASDWFGTLRGRFGYAFDRFLPFVSGGMAFGNVKGSVAGAGSFSKTETGWTAGGGLEYAFLHNWSAKVEYLYVDLGTGTCDAACSGTVPFDVIFKSNVVRAGLNYKF